MFQGFFQGNGSVLGLCILVCSVVVKSLRQEVHKVGMTMPIFGIKRSLEELLFVAESMTEVTTEEEVSTKAKSVSRTW